MLPKSESLYVEFKSDQNGQKNGLPDIDLIETVVGFSNTSGGKIYLGVEDDGTPTGIHNNHRDFEKILPLVANKTVPPVSVTVELLKENHIDIVCITVPKSNAIISTTSGKVLRRVLKVDGTPETVPMYPFQYSTRLSDLGRYDLTAEPIGSASLNDLDSYEFQRMRRIIRTFRGEDSLLDLSDEELAQALRLTVKADDRLVPTVAGLLILGREDKIIEHLPTAKASFQVLEGSNVRLNEWFSKPLLALFELFENYLKPWNTEREMDYGLIRIPIPAFDHRAFREALINAFAHRDYSVLRNIRLLIDDDGLSITSPGGFIEGVSQDNLLTVAPHGRNPALSDALKRIGLAERTGRGIDRIFEGSIVYGRPLPDYSESTSSYVQVFIPRAEPDLPFVKMLADVRNRDGKELPISSLMILSTLRTERRCDIHRLSERSMLSENKCKAVVERLVESGLVEGHGNNRGRTYMLSSKVYHGSQKSIDYVRQNGINSVKHPELVLQLAKQQGEVSRDDVCKLLGVTGPQAYRILKTLSGQRKLTLQGQGRNAKYVLGEEISKR
ncbi:MAG TPA: AAA family ATPase [Clostridiales bacterium]|nr:AAA family ATPase [Clostridiales bacterium]